MRSDLPAPEDRGRMCAAHTRARVGATRPDVTTPRALRKPGAQTAPVRLPGGFSEAEMRDALIRLCEAAGLDPAGATLLRGQTNAVLRLASDPVVLKIARRGITPARVQQTVSLVRRLDSIGFPTVQLHPTDQPVVVGPYIGTFYTHVPQSADLPPLTSDLAMPLRTLHTAGLPPFELPELDAIAAVRRSLAAADTLPAPDRRFLTKRMEQLAEEQAGLRYALPRGVLHGDPQHGNALRTPDRVVLCDWDSAVLGQPEWDLVTVEIHARRFGHAPDSYARFAEIYGFDVAAEWRGYRTLCDLRELRMITTNARKSAHEPDKMEELLRRIEGVRQGDHSQHWTIM